MAVHGAIRREPYHRRDDRTGGSRVKTFFRLPTAGVGFFIGAWLLMVFAGIVHHDVGIRPFGYVTSMLATIGLWLAVAPAIGAVARTKSRDRRSH